MITQDYLSQDYLAQDYLGGLDLEEAPELNSIIIVPATITGSIGNVIQLATELEDQFGDPIAASITWDSSNDLIATVDVNGVLTLVAAGTAVISATSGEISDTINVIVLAASTAVAKDVRYIRIGARTIPVRG